MIDKALLTGAFEKMGPNAVERGLREHKMNGVGDIWRRCFLARAYGPEGLMESELIAAKWSTQYTAWGMTPDEFSTVWRTVDMCHDEFFALANEWLENRPASIRVASRETVVEVVR